jgi:hypothetical protein
LSLEETCQFDSAICNRDKRRDFLDCLKSESCIFQGSRNQEFCSDGISWLKNRSINIRQLKCHRLTDEKA